MDDSFDIDLLRKRAVLVEREAATTADLASLWRELTNGESKIIDSFVAERCYVVTIASTPALMRPPLSERSRKMLEALLSGSDNKTVAFDFDVSQSTVSQLARQALQVLGVHCTPARACPLLALAAQASSQGRPRLARFGTFQEQGRSYRVFGTGRPDDVLASLLPPAEYAVARGLMEGRHYVDIARGRGTSIRTVANQLSAVFRRIGVSGRCSLLQHLINADPSVSLRIR